MDILTTSNALYLIIYWFPVNIQFSTFSLLIVYYAQLGHQHKGEMKAFKRRYIAVWVITNVIFFVLAAIWIGIGIKIDGPGGDEPDWLSSIHGYFTGAVFFILVIVLAWEGLRVSHLMREASGAQTKLLAKISFPKIVVVTFLLFSLFTTRCIYDVIMATGKISMEVSSGTTFEALFTFVAFLLWEIIPTTLVLVLFGKVSATTLGAFSKKKMVNPTVAHLQIQARTSGELPAQPLLKAQLFNDPRRYDSDEESSVLKSPLHFSGTYHSPYNTGPLSMDSVKKLQM